MRNPISEQSVSRLTRFLLIFKRTNKLIKKSVLFDLVAIHFFLVCSQTLITTDTNISVYHIRE